MTTGYTFSLGQSDTTINQRLIPQIIDENAAIKPNVAWAEVPVSAADYALGYRAITWKTLSNAVNGLAWRIQENLGKSSTFETLAYVGPSDVRYHMLLAACIKVGYKALLTSPRNSLEAHSNLFDKLCCKVLITTDPMPPAAQSITRGIQGLQSLQIPDLDELLNKQYRPYPYEKDIRTAHNDPIFCLHTSGSTGLPKPLIYTHDCVIRMANVSQLAPPDGYDSLNRRMLNNRVVCLLPPFHIAGVYVGFVIAMYNNSTMVCPISAVPPVGASLATILGHVTADWAFVAPVHVEDFARKSECLDFISTRLQTIIYSGGALPEAIGDLVSSKAFIQSFLGSSEFGGFAQILPRNYNCIRDWNSTQIHPFVRADFQVRDNGFNELVVKKDAKFEAWQPVFAMYPDTDEYHTKDLFSSYPERVDTWIYEGRDDDIVVLLNGEKTCPLTYEATVSQCPDVSSALVFGHQRFEAGILIELTPEARARCAKVGLESFVDSIWYVIERANLPTPAHARIFRSHIIFTTPEKPMLRSAKGTVQRQMTLKAYSPEIDTLYDSIAQLDASSLPNGRDPVQLLKLPANSNSTRPSVSGIRDVVSHVLKEIAADIRLSDKDDFFSKGFDSLLVLRASRLIRSRLGLASMGPDVIYTNPTVEKLVLELRKRLHGEVQLPGAVNGSQASEISNTTAKYTSYLEVLGEGLDSAKAISSSISQCSSSKPSQVVLLTGSTGSIGSYLLKALMESSQIKHVYCINRADGSEALQVSRNTSRDPALPKVFPPERVTFLKAQLTDVATLGLGPSVYDSLLSTVTVVLHNAWPVNFAQALPSFNLQFISLAHLSLFCARSHRKPTLIFLSSVAAVMNLRSENTPVAEEPTLKADPADGGYGQSKLVGERLLHRATEIMNVSTAVVRIGQVAGARRSGGGWNPSEWICRMIKSSRQICAVPDSLGAFGDRIDWVPIDVLADVLTDITLNSAGNMNVNVTGERIARQTVCHIVNPSLTTWAVLRDAVMQGVVASSEGHVQLVKPDEWMSRLRESDAFAEALPSKVPRKNGGSGEFDEALASNPALLLQDFLEATFHSEAPLVMSTARSVGVSKTLRDLTAVTKGEMLRWTQTLLRG